MTSTSEGMKRPIAIVSNELYRTLGEAEALIYAKADALRQVPEGYHLTGEYVRSDQTFVPDENDPTVMISLFQRNLCAYRFEIEADDD